MEARLVSLAETANQWELENGNSPSEPPLSEADRADAEWFLEEMLLIYPILGIDAFEAASNEPLVQNKADELILSGRGAKGYGRETADGFVVLSGSRARATEVPSIASYLHDLRQQLIERHVISLEEKHLVFTQDYRFASPSTAAGVLVGASVNGRVYWKNADGKTLKEIQKARTENVQ